ncbi:hypothetical protein HW511_14150 [Asaia siamensis]|uniref:Lipoprotein n=1 Tax=Asaia siamensis TaxID=110479 RepID=A0ABQ1MH55_9PROT|nr:hypothetical protein [Asaia siamensis]GBR07047.1 hypothetical protein AA0323_1652 [Asaia siamensis NRIC 0323]GGC40711.1 hypothetical protein GCM10007207_27610 [Asaia siamensis]
MRILSLCGAILTLTACSHPHPPQDDSRAALLRPVASTGSAPSKDAPPSDHKPHGHMYMGSGMGASHL